MKNAAITFLFALAHIGLYLLARKWNIAQDLNVLALWCVLGICFTVNIFYDLRDSKSSESTIKN